MSFSIVNNIAAANAQAGLSVSNMGLNKALARVSSGLRINNSSDDAAGLSVANSYRADIAIVNQGIRNANDGLSTLGIQDGALDNVSKLVNRLATLAAQAASGTTTTASRTTLNQEFTDILAEIGRESTVAGTSAVQTFSVFVSNNGANGKVSGTIAAVTTTTLGINASAVDTQANAETAVAAVAAAVTTLGSVQGTIGALQNRLQFAAGLAQSQVVNNTAAESRIRDANMAEETANLTKYSILTQSGIAALAQANSSSAAVLALLRQ